MLKDIATLINTFSTNNPGAVNAVMLMMPGTAAQVIQATNGVAGLTLAANTGGSYSGYPVLTSGAVGSRIVMLDAGAILYADGGVSIDVSEQVTVQLVSAPDSPPTAATVEVSLWQYGLVGLRAVRFLNWKRAKTSAVALVSPIAYAP